VPDLSGGTDPDDAFSSIPYEKGFYFLYYLQVWWAVWRGDSGGWWRRWQRWRRWERVERGSCAAAAAALCGRPPHTAGRAALASCLAAPLPSPSPSPAQELVGGGAAFEPFFKSWIQAHAFKTATSYDFRDFFLSHFKDSPRVAEVDWDK
jgi:hypothetical protein